jgi:hypothetical protein
MSEPDEIAEAFDRLLAGIGEIAESIIGDGHEALLGDGYNWGDPFPGHRVPHHRLPPRIIDVPQVDYLDDVAEDGLADVLEFPTQISLGPPWLLIGAVFAAGWCLARIRRRYR